MKRILLSLSILLISGTSLVSAQNSNEDDKWFDTFERADDLFDQKKYSEAIPLYTSVAGYFEGRRSATEDDEKIRKGNLALVYRNIGICHRNLEQYDQALDFLKRSIRYDSEDTFTYFQLSIVYDALEQYDCVEEACKSMLRIDPYSGLAYVSLGQLYLYDKEDNDVTKNTALYFYEKAIALSSSFANESQKYLLLVANMEAKMLRELGYSSSRANPAAIAIPTSAGTSGTAQSTTTTSGSSTATTSGSSTATSADYVRTRIGQLLRQCGVSANGDWAYTGYLKTNQKAFGIYQWADGTTYMGEYINDNFNGSCIIIPAKGEYYDDIPGWSFFQGVYENGKPKFGSGYDKNGNYIDTGIYINGKLQERYVNEDSKKGVIKLEVIVYDKDDSKNRDFYIGLTRYGKRHARGLLVWKNAEWYYGNWNVDKQQGLGMQVYSDGKYTTGKWSNGEFVNEL